MITDLQLDGIFKVAPSWTSINERKELSKLASDVQTGGLILEIGALYGGVTSVLALSAPYTSINVIDNFSWTPEGYPRASKDLLLNNVHKLGADNVFVFDMTSQEAASKWDKLIDLLWIDGGHSFDYVYFDLSFYGKFASVIALHDYDNEFWPDIRQAVEKFLHDEPNWRIDKVIDMVVILRKE